MDTPSNPYTPPGSACIDDSGVEERISVYTPFQIGLASFISGPVSAIYTLSRNYARLGKQTASQNVLIFGPMLLLGLIWLTALLPPRTSMSGMSLVCTIIATNIASSSQLTKARILESSNFKRASSWDVGVVCVASLITYFAVSISFVWLLEYLKVVLPGA